MTYQRSSTFNAPGGEGAFLTKRRPSLFWERTILGVANLNVITPVVITFDSQPITDASHYTVIGGGAAARIETAGVYGIAYSIGMERTGGGAASHVNGEVFKNSVVIPPGVGIDAEIMDGNPSDGHLHAEVPRITLAVLDLISIRTFRGSGGGGSGVVTIEAQSWLAMWFVEP